MDNLEKEMIDIVNNHSKKTIAPQDKILTKRDASALKIGLKRMLLALVTAVLFGLSVFAFIATATATGYWAVVLFLSAIVIMAWAFALLYAQGITKSESRGESK